MPLNKTLKLISTEQCIKELEDYANTKVRSWNPFKGFKKRKLEHYNSAAEIAKVLGKALISKTELLNMVSAIDKFENPMLQHTLLCFLYTQTNDSPNIFLSQRDNLNQINQGLDYLINKQYRPWWTLFLIKLPYYSSSFRDNLKWLKGNINDLFTTRRTEIKHNLITVYSNEEIVNQIISEYHLANTPKEFAQRKELTKILDLALAQTKDYAQGELVTEIKELVKGLPFGKVLISTAGLSLIINSYLSKNENQIKPKKEQAQEILYIIGRIYLKSNATYLVKSAIPGFNDVVEAVVSVLVSKSALNPLHTDQKIGTALASTAGGALGGALGTVLPFIGTYIGAYVGAVVSKTAAAQFYNVLEAWQKAPRGPTSIVPHYTKSFLALVDKDAKNILDPLYKLYMETENKSKLLGEEIAKWLCIYTVVQNSLEKHSEEYLEIINEEIRRLKQEFTNLKNSHSKVAITLYVKKPGNSARVDKYKAEIKECLQQLHQPIKGMLNEYFSPTSKVSRIRKELPLGETHEASNHPKAFFDSKKIPRKSTADKFKDSDLNELASLSMTAQ